MPGKLQDRSSRRARLIWGLALGFLIIILVRLFMPDLVWLGARRVTVSDIKPDSGLRLIGTLSDPMLSDEKAPSGARLDLVERKPGGFLHALDERFEGSWAFAWLTSLYDANYPAMTHETVLPLGPGGAPPADIAAVGGGRFSIHDGHVLFSLPGETKLADIHRLDIWVPRIKAFAGHELWPRTLRWLTGALIAVLVIGLLWITPVSIANHVWPGLTIALIMLPMLFAGRELYMRSTGQFPKSMMTWPATFSPEVGVVFAPRSVVRFTDGSEFWTADTTNSIGFLDNEPAIPKPSGTFRILLVGDSIVEALQVPLAQKMQTRLAATLRKAFPGQKTDVVAISRSGLGQGSELGFYNANRQIKPDLVILMFVGNDFANNSILLESMRSGFSPDHRPWWFPAIDDSKRCKLLLPAGLGKAPADRCIGTGRAIAIEIRHGLQADRHLDSRFRGQRFLSQQSTSGNLSAGGRTDQVQLLALEGGCGA